MDNLAERIGSILSDEESMKQIGELAAMLGLSDGSAPNIPSLAPPSAQNAVGTAASSAQGPDLGAMMSLMSKIKDFQAEDDNIRFLTALKPLLGEDKRIRIDRAVKILKLLNLLPLIKDSGLLGGDFLGIL